MVPITLGPHGSNFGDVVDALKSLRPLDAGIEVELQPGSGRKVLLCAFTMAYTGDMPQQQQNTGMKTQRANFGCRFCFISSDHRGDLRYDTFTHGRYHKQTMAMRSEMNSKKYKKDKDAYAKKWGLDTEDPCLVKISPALDIILSRPGDPAHSEYNGLTRIMHTTLLQAVLTTSAVKSYVAMLRKFPFPPSWPRVQGPLHHFKSYSLSEHARWSVVVPGLLRCWLQEKHLRPYFKQIIQNEGKNPVHEVIQCFAAAATSNCVLMGDSISQDDRSNMESIISVHREKFQALLKVVANSLTADPRRARSRSASIAPLAAATQSTTVAQATEAQEEVPKEIAALTLTYLNSMKLPNLHTALHYPHAS